MIGLYTINTLFPIKKKNIFYSFNPGFFPVRAGAAISKCYGSGFRCHLRPAIFSCTKQLVLLLDIANWCVLPYYFNILS